MSFQDEYAKLRKKRKQEENAQKPAQTTKTSGSSSFADEYTQLRANRQEVQAAPSSPGLPLLTLGPVGAEIAPVTVGKVGNQNKDKKKDENKRTWFQGGGFSDGYDLGDISKTIIGTVKDAADDLAAGAVGIVESTVDAGAYLVGGVGKAIGANKFASKVQDFIEKDLINEEKVSKNLFLEMVLNTAPALKTAIDGAGASYRLVSGILDGGDVNKLIKDEVKNLPKTILGTNPYTESGVDKAVNAFFGDKDGEEYSMLGDKSDSLVQSGGELLATAGLQYLGVPWYVTTGVTGAGREAEEAFKEDASYVEAGISSAITAGAEILTEKLSGGIKFGGKALDDVLTKKIARGVSNKAVRALAKLGVDMAGEGSEEILSGAMSALGQKITYADDKELTELFSGEDALEAFIGGAVLGGAGSGVNAINAHKNSVNAVSGLTAEEEQVVNKVYKDRIAEETEKNGKPSERKKNQIYDEVIEDLKNGSLSLDDIESVLDSERFNAYKASADEFVNSPTARAFRENEAYEKALSREIDELGKKTNATLAESARYAELLNKKEQFEADAKMRNQIKTRYEAKVKELNELRSSISNDMFGRLGNSRLAESYREQGRRGEKFAADLTKYENEHAKQTIQNLVDSELANNTNEFHRFADFMAKISADKGVVFSLTDAERLRGTRFEHEGRTTNAFVTEDGKITVNIDAKKGMESLVGHEVSHVLEGTAFYEELQGVVTQYAQTRGEYQRRLAEVTRLYEGIEGADVNKELTADLIGDYLFTDSSFVNMLSTKHRNVFQRVYDEIKYLYKVATAGSKEARQLERVKRVFDKAWRDSGKAQSGQEAGSVKNSLSDSEGNELSPAVQKRFLNSKAVDENGRLKVLYHGTAAGEFTIFDKAKGSVEGDFGSGFYFTDNDSDVTANYEGGGPDFKIKVSRRAEEIYGEEDIEYEEAEKRAYAELYKGANRFTVYLNIENPAIVGETVLFDADKYYGEYDREDFDSEEEYDEAVEQLISDEIDNLIWEVENKVDIDSVDGLSEILWESVLDGGVEVQALKEKIDRLYLEDSYGNIANNEVTRQILESLGYDGVIDSTVSSKWPNMHMEEGTTHYIVFKPNQIKNISNQNPTDNADINLSLSFVGENKPMNRKETYGQNIKYTPALVQETAPEQAASVKEQEIENATISPSAASLMELAKQSRREEHHGAAVSDGKQYITNGAFIVELDAVDESLERAKGFPIKKVKETLQETIERQAAASFHIDTGAIANIGEERRFVKVGESLFDVSYVNAVLQAIENPVFTVSNIRGGKQALVVSGSNGRAAIGSVEASGNVNIAYEAQPAEDIGRMFPDNPSLRPDDYDMRQDQIDSLYDVEAPPEIEAPYYESEEIVVADPMADRPSIEDIGNRKVKAYMYENPEVKPFFQEEAKIMLRELQDSTRGERIYLPQVFYDSNASEGWTGTKRQTTDAIAYLLDEWHYTYAEIEKGLKAIIEDNGKENNAVSKRIEFLLNDRLKDGHFNSLLGVDVPPNLEYIKLLEEKQVTEYSQEAFNALRDEDAPPMEAISPEKQPVKAAAPSAPVFGGKEGEQVTMFSEQPKQESGTEEQQTMFDEPQKIAKVLTEEPKNPKKKEKKLLKLRTHVVDDASVFEDISLKTGNRQLFAAFNYMRSANARADYLMKKGAEGVKSLDAMKEEAKEKEEDFFNDLYHKLNIDRMSLETQEHYEERMNLRRPFKGLSDEQIRSIANQWITVDTTKVQAARINAARAYLKASEGGKNKPVFGWPVSAEASRESAERYEAKNPEFKKRSGEVYAYNKFLRGLLVDGGVLSQKTADLFEKLYPHYVPIRRADHEGAAVNVPLDSNRTGVNAPIKRATGGNSDILPLWETMALRTQQVYRAAARNKFGLELMRSLKLNVVESKKISTGEIIDSFGTEEDVVQMGKDGKAPTFTVFDKGKRITFEITEEIYDALKPTTGVLADTYKGLNKALNIQRALLTEQNPFFAIKQLIKDPQDIILNSQHPARTYANLPLAIGSVVRGGRWASEYYANGGMRYGYFDNETNTFATENKGLKKILSKPPFTAISALNNFIDSAPRLAEYIASRKAGNSVEIAMLNAANVTTNFAASGDAGRWVNRNFANFTTASISGFAQQVRNIREANAKGIRGWLNLAARVAIAGAPLVLFNNMVWGDDDEYEELSDYVKQNYYIMWKTEEGKFIRIPKGRSIAALQYAFEQLDNLRTGNKIDLKGLLDLYFTNLAPNSPIDDNLFSPLLQAAGNKAWHGGEIVPSNMETLPTRAQFDEGTDEISKWIGANTDPETNAFFGWAKEQLGLDLGISPMKANYVLDQYSGVVGDLVLPMITSDAKSSTHPLLAPLADPFVVDGTMKNQSVSDFYDKRDELTTKAKSDLATDRDILSSKYINSMGVALSDLYDEQHKIQGSDMPREEKYKAAREIQEEINALAEDSLNAYDKVNISGGYATVGSLHYRKYKGEWEKLTDKQVEKQNKVTGSLGISPSEYWANKEECDYAYEYPDNYAVSQVVGGYDAYTEYRQYLFNPQSENYIGSDKDENGKSISGSRQPKVVDYLNGLDISYEERLILYKSVYNSYDDENYAIFEYINNHEGLSFEQKKGVLRELGFNVSQDGDISWD